MFLRQQRDDMSILNAEVVQYRREETARFVADPLLLEELLRAFLGQLARESGRGPNTIRRARRSDGIQKRIAAKLAARLKQIAEQKGRHNRLNH